MPLNRQRCGYLLRSFNLSKLFIEELGWDSHSQTLDVPLDGRTFSLSAAAHKRGFVAFQCTAPEGRVPDYATRRKIETQVAKSVHEHLIIYSDATKSMQVWQWVKREPGKPSQCRDHIYTTGQSGEALIQKLEYLAFSLEEEEQLTIVDVHSRIQRGLYAERVTKRFYDRFKTEHAAFLKFVKGIPDEGMQRWYVSVTLNRLMFIYFLQKKGFLDGDVDYLRRKLEESKRRGRDRFYRDFLCPLFFEGFAKKESDRSPEANRLLGKVPYLNGGIFMRHQIEEAHGQAIAIPDGAFERIFGFFDDYRWHLDERPLRNDQEINPDVLGYIFEKYINQKQMGAYYSKEDITGYISQNTVIPYLFDVARRECKVAFEGESSVWRLLRENPDRYIYETVRRGVITENGEVIPETALPDFVQTGMHDPKARIFDKRYNLGQAVIPDAEGNNLALPTETWREYVTRRRRCLELRAKLAAGEVREINDLITYNLDIRQFAQDAIEGAETEDRLRGFWHAIERVSVLDPTCGSGAFLFAALNILEPLYEACLERMAAFVEDLARSGQKHSPKKLDDFRKVLARMAEHPNHRYFVLKSIVINNLFGVDIMEEAVEICKLRLFLKLVAQLEPTDNIEPLPDIDFNIQAGNTLVGYARLEDIRRGQGRLDFEDALARIEQKAIELDEQFNLFRQQQTELGGEVTAADKAALRTRLRPLEDELNQYLSSEYAVDVKKKDAYAKWLASHKPFHWFVEFYGIMNRGGFDVIIGNPPYLDLRELTEYTLKGYPTTATRNLSAVVLERCQMLVSPKGRQGYIVPVASVATDGYSALQEVVTRNTLYYSSFDDRPAHLFDGLDKNTLSILLLSRTATRECYSTRLCRWNAEERIALFPALEYSATPDCRLPGCLPKVGSHLERSVWEKLFAKNTPLLLAYDHHGQHVVHYSRKINAFIQVLDFVPEVHDGKGRVRPPSEFKALHFGTAEQAAAVCCCQNSTLFRWFLDATTDGSHLNRREIDNFPFDVVSSVATVKAWNDLAERLSGRLRETSQVRTMRYPHDTLTVQCLIPKHAKSVIDEIDRVLAKHYGFTDEELDFIVNYDIKYRMGRNAEQVDEE
jgi:hypothetical protein